jgi:hypothetical protein
MEKFERITGITMGSVLVACLSVILCSRLYKGLFGYHQIEGPLYLLSVSSLMLFAVIWQTKGRIYGFEFCLSIYLTAFVLFTLLLLFCEWRPLDGANDPPGWQLVSPWWLGGSRQLYEYCDPSEWGNVMPYHPSKLSALIDGITSFKESHNSVFFESLFSWPGLILWAFFLLVFPLRRFYILRKIRRIIRNSTLEGDTMLDEEH